MVRLTSSFYVSHLVRRVSSKGGFAAIVRKGAEEAGAIHIVLRGRKGDIALYAPAPQYLFKAQEGSDRAFVHVENVSDDATLNIFIEKEARFDADLWLVELETGSLDPADLFPVKIP